MPTPALQPLCSTPKPLLNRAGQEKDKLEVLREIGMTNVRITEGLTTLNQMTGAVPFFREFFELQPPNRS